MIPLETRLIDELSSLLEKFNRLPDKNLEAERKAEEFLQPVFEELGWNWLSSEVTPQRRIRGGTRTTRADYSLRREGELKHAFLLEVKRFSADLDDENHVLQALNYGKNSGTRWVVLTNFVSWRVFNSDFFNEPRHAELFRFELRDALEGGESLKFLQMLAREERREALDDYAKRHGKWRESADIEELLTERLVDARKKLSKAIYEQNTQKFDTGSDKEDALEACVQHLLERIIFCRMLEDNGADSERRLYDSLESWSNGDRRVQFYADGLCDFFARMHKQYDSTIFDQDRIDRLSIANKDFIPILESFYQDPETGLRYRFDAIELDVLGHAYENYLSARLIAKRKGSEDEKSFVRKQSGIYYTPAFLVNYLVHSTLGEKLKKCKAPSEALRLRVLDPACGSGTFLVRAFEEFKQWFESLERNGSTGMKRQDFLDAVMENCIYGIDKDPRAVRLARLNLFLRVVEGPRQLPQLKIIERDSLVWDADIKGAFVFERDFPLVAESGGFNVILGNPPWEKWKPDSQEFFEVRDPGFKSLPTQEAKKRMEQLLESRPGLRKEWFEKENYYQTYSDIFRENYEWQSAEANGKRASGDLDLYKLFTERFHQLLKEGGLAGIVVPSGVYTDLGAKGLRALLFDHSQLKALYSFENRGHAIFPDVHASYKPILLVFQKGGKTTEFPCAFFLHSADDLQKAQEKPTIMKIEFVKKSSPTSWSILEIKTPQDYAIVNKLLKFPPLGAEIKDAWNITISRGFDMTNDSHLFKSGTLGGIPLLEGKNIHQFTHQWKEAPVVRYKVFEKDIQANLKLEKIYHEGYWIAYRLIGRSTDSRTLISTVVPPSYVCGNSLAIVRLLDLKQLCFLCGILNSFVVDYFIRQKVSANINLFYFLETPVPRLSSGVQFDFIARKTAQLVAITDGFEELKKAVGVQHALINETERTQARAQLDVAVAKLYGLTKQELEHILSQFPIVEERQKRMVLDAFEA